MPARRIARMCTASLPSHRDSLVDQSSSTWARHAMQHSLIAAGKWYNPYVASQVAMVNTLRNRLAAILAAAEKDKRGPPKVCIWDEAHHISAATWAAIMDMLPDTIHIGLSATPQRLDG